MLIFLTDDGKLRSRALLWDEVIDNHGVKYKFMDRIYSIYDHDVYLFKSWAKENGYITKLEQDCYCELEIIDLKDQPHLVEYYKLIVTPALVKVYPLPEQILMGSNLTDQLEKWFHHWHN
jgi:hypothetical protein